MIAELMTSDIPIILGLIGVLVLGLFLMVLSGTRMPEKLPGAIDYTETDIPKGGLRMELKRLAYGYRVYVYDGDDLVFMSTNYKATEEEARKCAEKYFCQKWYFNQID